MKPFTALSYILVKVAGLLIIIGIIMTVMFPDTWFTNIVCNGTLDDAAGNPLAAEQVDFYSGIVLGAYTNAEPLTTDEYGRFQAVFRKEYAVTKLESLLKLRKTAAPPFYFGIKLSGYDDGDPGKLNGHYYIVKVTKSGATVSAVKDRGRTPVKGKAAERLKVSAKLSRDADKWYIDVTIKETARIR